MPKKRNLLLNESNTESEIANWATAISQSVKDVAQENFSSRGLDSLFAKVTD